MPARLPASDVFRQRLQHITTRRHADDWPSLISALRSEYSHSIVEVRPGPDGRYNCFAFALGLHQSEKYFRVAKHRTPNVFANATFVQHVIDRQVLRPIDCSAPAETLILYFRQGMATHAGLLNKERVTSKWGDGKFFEHGIYEVPADYGCETRCYDLPASRGIEAEFLSYAAERGVPVAGLVAGSR